MKFKETVSFEGDLPDRVVHFNDPELTYTVSCPRLDLWLSAGRSVASIRVGSQLLHLFHSSDEEFSICGRGMTIHGGHPYHAAPLGRKLRVCTKCRRIAEGGE